MTAKADVAIIGGGVVGLTTAYYLKESGTRVVVVDKDDLGRQASWAGAGIIPPGVAARARTPLDRLRAVSAEMYPQLSRDLLDRTGIDNGYRVCGSLELTDPPLPSALAAWRAEGIEVRELEGSALHRVEPELSPAVRRGRSLPGMAQVRNPRHLKALIADCAAGGVRLRPHHAAQTLIRKGDRIEAVRTQDGDIAADRFLVAAGAWTDELLGPLGWRPGVRPIRGQIALLRTDAARLTRILVEGKRYIVPRPDGLVLVGATEEDVGFDERTTAAAVAGLLEFAVRLAPALSDAHVERCWAGLRPGSPDGLPFLGRVPHVENLFIAAGHFRAGIQQSPATGRAMADLLLDRPPAIPLEAFRPDRPPAPPTETAFRS
jgi:glycine oxidase